MADEGGFKDMDVANKEKSRLYALLKDKKEKYNATMAGQLDYDEQKLQDEIEELENELGIGEATQPELPGMTPQNTTLNINVTLSIGVGSSCLASKASFLSTTSLISFICLDTFFINSILKVEEVKIPLQKLVFLSR